MFLRFIYLGMKYKIFVQEYNYGWVGGIVGEVRLGEEFIGFLFSIIGDSYIIIMAMYNIIYVNYY